MLKTDPASPANPRGDRLQARRRMAAILGCANDEAFALLIWGVNALQSGNPDGGALVFPKGVPPQVATEDMSTGWSIYPWELETLANELLASPKSLYQTIQCDRWELVPEIVNLLRRVDDLDFAVRQGSVNIYDELFRIAGRQFEWQQGFFSVSRFYRNNFIYGEGACAEYFREKYGITINDLSVVGFGMFASMMQRPNFMTDVDFGLLGLSAHTRDTALAILAAPLSHLRKLAAREREQWETMAYLFSPEVWRYGSLLNRPGSSVQIRATYS